MLLRLLGKLALILKAIAVEEIQQAIEGPEGTLRSSCQRHARANAGAHVRANAGSNIINDGEAAGADVKGAVGCEKAHRDPDDAREQAVLSDSPDDAVDAP